MTAARTGIHSPPLTEQRVRPSSFNRRRGRNGSIVSSNFRVDDLLSIDAIGRERSETILIAVGKAKFHGSTVPDQFPQLRAAAHANKRKTREKFDFPST